VRNLKTSPFVITVLLFALFSCKPDISDDGRGNMMVGQEKGDYQAFFKTKSSVKGAQNKVLKVAFKIPDENLFEPEEPPLPDVDTEEDARTLIDGLSQNNEKFYLSMSVPIDLMERIKDMHLGNKDSERKAARRYAAKLRKGIKTKIKKILKKTSFTGATFESIVLGKCKWVGVQSNWNRYAYWICRSNVVYYHLKGDRKSLKIKKMFNWGKRWFILKF
jgi:hypothetical protein